jgi:regulation of enolase protein 1 (concanavalin A-like superfamily)
MRLILQFLAFAIVCVLAGTAAEASCRATGPILFQDHFETLAPAWGSYQNYHVANGKLVIQPPAGRTTSTLNGASLYDDVDICAEMTVAPPVIKGNCGGIVFWAVDYDNYYTAQVSTDGWVSVWRLQKGKWLNQVPLQDFSAVRRGANQVNEIRVVTSGNKAAISINGKLLKQISGQPPEGGSEVGLIACSPNNVSAAVAFNDIVVSGPPGSQPVALAKPGEFPPGGVSADCRPSDKALFQDSFQELAPSWGTSDNYHVEAGRLVIQPPAGFNTATVNNAALYDDVDICANMNVPTLVKDNCGGIIFWASDYDNYYSLQVSTNGEASIWRRQRGKWLVQMDWQKFGAVHPAANQVNVLRVQTAGSRARVFVNGQLFGEVTGQPPQGGSQLGLMACSPNDASARVEFTGIVVSAPGGQGAPGGIVADSGAAAVDAACKPTDKTQFQDYFKELATSWGSSDNYHVEAGRLVIQPPAGYNTATINNASLYDDVDVCAQMIAPTLVKGNCGGIVFWAIDYDNYYTLQVSTDGQASVWRRQKGKWLNQVDWQDFAAVRAAANQINTMRVVTAGNKARFFVNGALFKELTGQPPSGGAQVGLLACSPNDASARVEFSNFIVSAPGGGAPPAEPKPSAPPVIAAAGSAAKCEAPRDALFTDKFDTLEASWGTYDNYKVEGGEFLITPPAGYNTTAINTASLYDDVDLCVGMKARAPASEGTCGALVFWAEDYDNYYSFQVSTDGQASFWRRQRGKWLNQVNWQAADGVNTGEGFNQLRVVTAGRSASLFVNGKLFKQVQGQPPASGQQIGLMACAPDKQAAAVGFDDLVVAAPGSPAGAPRVDEKVAGKKTDDKAVEAKSDDKVAENKVDEKKVVADDQAIAAPQGRRVALVIGIGAYKAVPELPNPPRDATDVAAELSSIGFDVTHVDNLDALAMRKALRDFEQKADGASIAIVYYAGHGMEVNGVNYLIPVDAQLVRDTDIEDEAISLNRVLSAVSGARDLRLVLLDACRNNPFAAKMAHADGTRAVSRGLARIEPGSSTLVAFSAKEGTTAEDGDGRNSPFATALLANLNRRGLEISFLFRRVRDQVMSETGNRQEPFVYGSLSAVPIYLAGQ